MLRSFLIGLRKENLRSLSSVSFVSENLLDLTNNKHKNRLNRSIYEKLNSLPVKINTNNLDLATLDRLNVCSKEFLSNLVFNLNEYGLKDKLLTNALKSYDDWSLLSRSNLNDAFQLFRELSFPPELYMNVISKNQNLIAIERKKLQQRMIELKEFFSNKQLQRLLIRSPELLTNNFDNFRYKFTYAFILMGFQQKHMASTYFFNHSIEFIRERHLFLERSAFYDKPDKKGISKVENPKMSYIFDTNLKEYLRICTRNNLDEHDYAAFCDYLKKDNFNDELLGNRIGRLLQTQIIQQIRMSRADEMEHDADDYEDDEEKK